MLLPFREHLDFGPTPYDQLQAKEGLPVIRGNVVSDVMKLELGRWERMGVAGCYLNLAEQQQTDAYVCEIPPGGQTLRAHGYGRFCVCAFPNWVRRARNRNHSRSPQQAIRACSRENPSRAQGRPRSTAMKKPPTGRLLR